MEDTGGDMTRFYPCLQACLKKIKVETSDDKQNCVEWKEEDYWVPQATVSCKQIS